MTEEKKPLSFRFELDVNRRNIPDDVLLDDLKTVAASLKQPSVTGREYDKYGTYNKSSLIKRFGGWSDALKKAGLVVKHHNAGVGAEDAIADLRGVAANLRKESVTQDEYSRGGHFSPGPLIRHFGSWFKALEAAGLKPTRNLNIPQQLLFENLEKMWRTLGRQPKYTEVEKPFSAYSGGTYEARFGSWRKALEAFVQFINSDKEIEKPTLKQKMEGITEQRMVNRKTSRAINLRLRFRVLQRDNFTCRACGKSPATVPGLTLHVDHKRPWSKDGETVIENLQTLCEACNLGKSDMLSNV
jgi:hypothetical protein